LAQHERAQQPDRGFWTAEVAWPAANVHAKPNAGSEIRRVANEGDLLRVAGRSHGIDGDGGEWWATTDGYVAVDGLRGASGEWVDAWQIPAASEAANGFWVEVTSAGQVRAGPTTTAPVVGTLESGTHVKVLAEEQDPDGDPVPWYRIDGGRYAGGRLYSGRTTRLPDPQPNATAPAEGATGRWLVVDRKASTLTLVRDGAPELTTYVSLGRAGVDTPSGQYRIVNALRSDDMSSARNPTADRSYEVPGVPSVQYFTESGDAIHGTYWHDKFGAQESQGCINLTIADAAYLFDATAASTPLVILD
jgi:lipoprotein-anchoring transpeptidase ErfK/SrfK